MQINKRCLMVLTDVNMGGVTTAAINFCNGLVERGAQVDVLLLSDCPEASERGFAEGIRFLNLKGSARLWNLGPSTVRKMKNPVKKAWYLFLGGVKRIANKRNKWNAMVFCNKKRFTGYDAVIAYRQCPACYYFALHNVEAAKKVAFVHGELAFMGDISTWQPYMKEFDAVAYVSNGVKEGFIAAYPELAQNAVTVYNTFLVEEILRKAQLPCPVTFDRTRLNLVTVSRIENTMKGTGRIAPLCQKLKERYPNQFHWYVVGDGPDLAGCQKKAEKLGVTDHLTFLGASTNPFHYLAQADMCIFPTLTEAFPMVVVESLIVGVPVIASRYPAVAEVIVDGENGLIAEQNLDHILERITLLFEDRALLVEIKKNCAAYRYDNDRSYKQFLDAIES
jgi:glycosyltransferase involved in cell wall biosynthesis